MAPPRVSAVIPTYNRGALVVRAVQSALAQTHPPDEIVVVDDGSSDDTSERLAPYLDRVKLVRQANAGGAAARNRGVQEARCPWIAFLDSDDVWDPEHLHRMGNAIVATGGTARFYFSDMLATFAEGPGSLWTAAGFHIDGPWASAPDATDWVMEALQPTMLQSSVIGRDAFEAAGRLNEDLAVREDTLLFFRLGVGAAACAVAGIGTVMSSDDAPGRLTSVHDPSSERYWRDTVTLYRTVLDQSPSLSREQRRELGSRLAVAHLCLGRHALARRAPLEASGEFARALRAAPASIAQRAVRRATRALRFRGGSSRTPG